MRACTRTIHQHLEVKLRHKLRTHAGSVHVVHYYQRPLLKSSIPYPRKAHAWPTPMQAFVYDTLVASSSGRASESGEDASAKTIGPASAGAAPASCAPTASGADGAAGGGHQLVPLALSGQEQDVLRWGRNAAVNIPRHLPAMVYKKATAVEVLVSRAIGSSIKRGGAGLLQRAC